MKKNFKMLGGSIDSVPRRHSFLESSDRYRIICNVLTFLFIVEWILLAFNVQSRSDWLLENLLVFIFIVPAVYLYQKNVISAISYMMLIVFMSLHSIGAHYTYSLVPYDDLSLKIFGFSFSSAFNWERNNFDRMIHFLWGFLLFRPLCDLYRRVFQINGKLLYAHAILAIVISSTGYELVEWAAAMIFGGELGVAYVGAQGDVWDSQRDQALAILGALFGFLIFYKAISSDHVG